MRYMAIIAALLIAFPVYAKEDALPNVQLEDNNEENQPEPDDYKPPKNPGEYEYDAPPNPADENKNRHGGAYDEDWVDDVSYPRHDHREFKKVIRKIRTILDVVEAFADGVPLK